jgi:hypothetical protein
MWLLQPVFSASKSEVMAFQMPRANAPSHSRKDYILFATIQDMGSRVKCRVLKAEPPDEDGSLSLTTNP